MYKEFRPYGKIDNIVVLPGVLKDTRIAHVQYQRVRSAISARNCVHGEKVGMTRLFISYESPLIRNYIFNFVKDNPRLSIPVILGLLTIVSLLIFDPMRVFFVTNEISKRYSLEKYIEIVQEWINNATGTISDIFYGDDAAKKKAIVAATDLLSERAEQMKKLKFFLK